MYATECNCTLVCPKNYIFQTVANCKQHNVNCTLQAKQFIKLMKTVNWALETEKNLQNINATPNIPH